MLEHLRAEIAALREAGLYKAERVIASPQDAAIRLADGRETLNFCANNYLGLSNHPDLIAAAKAALESRGYGMSSVRFICGTQDIHRQLEGRISAFLGMEDTILYGSCFDANTGLFETLLGENNPVMLAVVISRLYSILVDGPPGAIGFAYLGIEAVLGGVFLFWPPPLA